MPLGETGGIVNCSWKYGHLSFETSTLQVETDTEGYLLSNAQLLTTSMEVQEHEAEVPKAKKKVKQETDTIHSNAPTQNSSKGFIIL